MNIRGLLTAGAAIATLAGAALGGSAAAATSIPAAVSAPAKATAHPVPAAAFKSAAGHVGIGRIAGVTRTTSARLAPASQPRAGAAGTNTAGTAAATCATEPNCNLVYNGGPVQHTPKVYVVFWGPDWTSNANDQSAETYLLSFYQGLGVSPETWSIDTAQYGDSSGHATFGSAVLAGHFNDTSTPVPNPVTANDLANEAVNALSQFSISNTNDAQMVIVTQSGTCYADESGVGLFAGSCGQVQTTSVNGLYCGYHSSIPSVSNPAGIFLPYVVLPYQPDAGTECGQDFVNATTGTFDGFSIVGGHEYAETITDPDQYSLSTLAWVDLNDALPPNAVSGGEIADKCAWGGQPWNQSPADPSGDITLSTGSFAMQSLWSNATDSCVMTGSLPLSVTTPATQSSILGKAAALQISATVGGSTPLTYSASGLPPGLSINKSTGKISGTPTTTAGVYTTKVTVSYYAGSATVSFGWQVSSAPGFIVGSGAKCVDNYLGHTTAGNKIVQAYCSGGTEQRITFTAGRQLQVQGQCVTGGTSAVVLESCASATSKVWTRLSNSEYVNKATGKCLTDPNNSTTNGIALTVATCANTASQHWTLPVSLVGPVKGYGSKCVDDYLGHTTAGNKIDLYTCNGGNSQRITLAANYKLQVLGNCITGGSSTVVLEPCSTSASEGWTYLPNHEWVNRATGKCLTDPNNSTTNGIALTVAACANTANQHWTLP